MTEYDYSPEAYQHYMDKMHSISRWAQETEHYRPEYENAAALTEGERNRGRSSPPSPSRERSRRRAPPPPPLPLPPLGHDYGDYGMHSAHPSPAGFEFPYAHGPGSPGPMPPHMYYPGAPQISLISPPISPMVPMPSYRPSRDHHHHSSRHSSRRGRSRSRGPSRSSSVSYGPGSVIYAPPVSAPAYSGGFYISPPPSRHGHHPQYSGPVYYV